MNTEYRPMTVPRRAATFAIADPSTRTQADHRQPGSPWSLQDSAIFLGVSHRHLARCLESGAIKSLRIGRRVLIADAELRRVASEGTR